MNLLTGFLTGLAWVSALNGLGLIALLAATRRHESRTNPGKHRAIPKHAATTAARR